MLKENEIRTVTHLSPTSLSTYLRDKDAFYTSYLAENRPPRMQHTKPMSIGSSFDAYAKSYLYEQLKIGNDVNYSFESLFKTQVEEHNRTWAREHGKIAFDAYAKSGALGDLLAALKQSVGRPRFEFDVTGMVSGFIGSEQRSVLLKGKPDTFYINSAGARVILDWKVNGYCAESIVSPMPGYIKLRSAADQTVKQHKDAFIMTVGGVKINAGTYLENLNEDWARQLSFYGWLCGCEVGSEFIVAIDQLACGAGTIRIAEHRLRISPEFQFATFEQAVETMDVITSDHYFRDLSKEDSAARCLMLDQMAETLEGDGSSSDDWFSKVTR